MTKSESDKTEPKLVAIAIFGDELEANLAKGRLQASGIDCTIGRDDCGGLRPALALTNGIKLIVRSEDANGAAGILSKETGG